MSDLCLLSCTEVLHYINAMENIEGVSMITTIQSCISQVSDNRLSSDKYLLNDSPEE
jgi:hypothetical protein